MRRLAYPDGKRIQRVKIRRIQKVRFLGQRELDMLDCVHYEACLIMATRFDTACVCMRPWRPGRPCTQYLSRDDPGWMDRWAESVRADVDHAEYLGLGVFDVSDEEGV